MNRKGIPIRRVESAKARFENVGFEISAEPQLGQNRVFAILRVDHFTRVKTVITTTRMIKPINTNLNRCCV